MITTTNLDSTYGIKNEVRLKWLKPRKAKSNQKFFTFDIETKDGLVGSKVHSWAFCYSYYNKLHTISGTDNNFSKMFKYLNKTKHKTRWKIVYAHNLWFDFRHIEKYCYERGIKIKVIRSGSNVICGLIPEFKIKFIDSLQFLLMSQEKAEKEWDIPKKYRKIDCNDLFDKDYSLWSKEDKKRVLEHNKNDVKALYCVLEKLRQFVFDEFNVDIISVITIASLCIKAYRRKMYKTKDKELKDGLLNPFLGWEKGNNNSNRFNISYFVDEEKENFVRKSYFGGRCEVFNTQQQDNVVYFDRNSMFPAEMATKRYPYGKPNWFRSKDKEKHGIDYYKNKGFTFYIKNKNKYIKLIKSKTEQEIMNMILNKTIFIKIKEPKGLNNQYEEKYVVPKGFIEAKIIPNKDNYPLLPYRRNMKVLFTHCERKWVYTTAELKKAQEIGYNIECYEGLIYPNTKYLFKEYMNFCYGLRKTFDKKTHGGQNKMVKFLMNPLYGKMGQKIYNAQTKYELFEEEDSAIEFMAKKRKELTEEYKKKGIEFTKVPEIKMRFKEGANRWVVLWKEDYVSKKPYQNVALASFTTAYSRIELYNEIKKVEELGGEVFYTDTDSVAVKLKVLMENKKKLNYGYNLGEWKTEVIFNKVQFLAPKGYFAKGLLDETDIDIDNFNIDEVKSKYNNERFLKLKGLDRRRIKEITKSCKTMDELNKRVKEKLNIPIKYAPYASSHNKGYIIYAHDSSKQFSFNEPKRKFFKDGTSIPFNNLTIPYEIGGEIGI